ncbi:SIR2 family protein [Sorangium sp. So ce887]|uniref:SIR2 family protein n=1 Tax=Sorangium sp. So ce887 TaxID=3133324 RepID=UPI003F606767
MAGLLGEIDVSWTRFWIPRDTAPVLDRRGYLTDPERQDARATNPLARTLEQLEDKPCVALLGEPGSGKSYAVGAYVASLRAEHFTTLLHVDCRWRPDLQKQIFATEAFEQWLANRIPLTIVVDSLDEHPRGAYEVASQLIDQIRRGPVGSLRLRIACRTAEWPAMLDEQLPLLWKPKGEEPQATFHALAPLRQSDVELAAGKDAAGFLAEIARVDAGSLAIKPITLGFLLEEYRRCGKLPRTRLELYEKGCRILCEESSRSRRGARRTGKLRAPERLAIASRIAAVCVLGRRSVVFTGQDLGTVPPEAVTLEDLTGAAEPSASGRVTVDTDALEEVLNVSGLFAPRGSDQIGWAHQTYAEFLAARFLRERGLSTEHLVGQVSNGALGRVVPALRETVAWLASMSLAGTSQEFFLRMLVADPEPLLGSDFALVGNGEREALVGALLKRLDRREMSIMTIQHRSELLVRLEHAALADQLRPYITGRDHYIMARRAALEFMDSCKVVALEDVVADVVLDGSDDKEFRSSAARTLVRIGSRETKRRLLPLLGGDREADPEDELKGYALLALWPDDITAAELFASLMPSQRSSYGGSYGYFLDKLSETLPPAALSEALHWTLGLPSRRQAPLELTDLLDTILRTAWERLEDAEVRALLAQAAVRRLAVYDVIFQRRNHRNEETPDPARDDGRRRLLATAMVALLPWGPYDTFSIVHHGLVLPKDVPWVIEQLRNGATPLERDHWAAILKQVALSDWTFEVADPILGAVDEVGEIREAMPCLINNVELGSALSRWMRRACRQERKFRGRFRVKPRVSPKVSRVQKRIQVCLRRFAEGDIDAGWRLQSLLAVDSEGRLRNDLHYREDLRNFPGWQRADEETKNRVLDVGREYLLLANERFGEWLGVEIPYGYRPAAVGYRYVCLIDALDPAWLDEHAVTVWANWSAIALAFAPNVNAQSQRVVSRAYRAEPPRVRDVLRALLDEDHRKHGQPLRLHHMAACWDADLGRFLIEYARRPDLKPRFLGDLLDELILHGVEGATDAAVSILNAPIPEGGPGRLRAHAAAHALMAFNPKVGWPVVRPLVEVDPAFGKEVFLTFVRAVEPRHSSTWGKCLSLEDAMTIYVWIERHFPSDSDPQDRQGEMDDSTSRHRLAELRNSLLGELSSRGTLEAVAAIEQIQQTFPDRDFTWVIHRAKDVAAQGIWIPRSPCEVIDLGSTTFRTMPSHHPPAAMHRFSFPAPLVDAYRKNKLAVLFGSGLSMARDVQGSFPSWNELPERLFEQAQNYGVLESAQLDALRLYLKAGHVSLESMLTLLDLPKTSLRAHGYQAALNAIFRPPNAAPGDVHRALVELGLDVLVTTNYDQLLEKAELGRQSYTWKKSDSVLSDINGGRKVLYKIHGTADDQASVVMTQGEYTKASSDEPYRRTIGYLLQAYTFLLVGYGINDPLDLDLVFELNLRAFGSATSQHYALMANPNPNDRDRWQRELNVQALPYQDHDDLPAILRALRATKP